MTVDADLFASLKKRMNQNKTDGGDSADGGPSAGPGPSDPPPPAPTGGEPFGNSAVLEPPSDGDPEAAPAPSGS